ncbi:MAG TPA: FHA domain-containing protein [Pseudomonadota bacterium]|nr:FHA domain-containing protein [Pseudomonadota bacterium]
MAKLFYRDVSGFTGTVDVQNVPVLIGRATDCQIQTQDAQVSRRHARVVFDGAAYWIEDTGSANGVYVGNERVARYALFPGAVFRCGHLEVRFEADPAPVAPVPPQDVPVSPNPPVGPVAPVAPSPPIVPVAPSPPIVPVAPVAPPPVSAPSSPAAQPQAESTVGVDVAALRNELEAERRKRSDLEFEIGELKRALEEAQTKSKAAPVPEGDTERLRRRVEQLESEVKRKGGGGGGGAPVEALRAAEAERDRLRAQVAELEAAAKNAAKNDDQDMELIRLRRKVEQLEADLRRVRGGKPPEPVAAPASTDALVSELEEKVRRLTDERDEALKKATVPVLVAQAAAPATDPKVAEELDKAKRRIDQLESELRRKPVGQVAENQRVSEQRAELETALRQLRDVEKERDKLRQMVATSSGGGRPSKTTLDGLQTVADGLADIRAALRAAGDDVALEQLEQLRATLRQALTALGL